MAYRKGAGRAGGRYRGKLGLDSRPRPTMASPSKRRNGQPARTSVTLTNTENLQCLAHNFSQFYILAVPYFPYYSDNADSQMPPSSGCLQIVPDKIFHCFLPCQIHIIESPKKIVLVPQWAKGKKKEQ